MSRINGDRSRYNRVRKARLHNRETIRTLKKKALGTKVAKPTRASTTA